MKTIPAISLGAIGVDLDSFKGTKERVHVARLYGEATDIRVVGRGKNASESIMGDIRAVNIANGEESKSAVVYFVRGLQELVIYNLEQGDNGKQANVRFAYDMYVAPDVRNPEGYSVEWEDLLEDKAKPDPMADLASKLPALKKK